MKKLLLLATTLVLAGCLSTGSKDVRIAVSLPPKLDLANYDHLYFPGFISEIANERIDTEREALNFLKREFRRRAVMDIIPRNPVDLSEKDPRSFFLKDQPYFKTFNFENVESTLALTGVISYEAVDRSGFREVEQTDFQGRRVAKAQFVEITSFNLSMQVYVYDLNEGKLLYSDVLQDSAEVEGANPDERLVLFDLLQRVSGRVLGLFSNTTVRAERSLL